VLIVGAFGLLFHAAARTSARAACQQVQAECQPARLIGRSGRGARTTLRRGQALTPRELDVLEQLASSRTYQEIAVKLGVTEETVRSHSKSILHKLGQPDRTQAVVAALRDGILEISDPAHSPRLDPSRPAPRTSVRDGAIDCAGRQA
jgi:DNA-binding NarL/FixJ family response regulator